MSKKIGDYVRAGGWWYYYLDDDLREDLNIVPEKCGKWMYFFYEPQQEFAKEICTQALRERLCCECKCTDIDFFKGYVDSGVICFYINGDDIESHKRVIKFLLDNNLVRKTKAGKYYNLGFKFDFQTGNREYRKKFKSKIRLEHFIDLYTGEWLDKKHQISSESLKQITDEIIKEANNGI